MTIDIDRGGKSVTETSIDTNNDQVSSYGDIKWLGACYILQRFMPIVLR